MPREGPLLGWKAPRHLAIVVQALCAVVAAAVLIATTPRHGGTYADAVFIIPIVAVVSALTLWGGFALARRSR